LRARVCIVGVGRIGASLAEYLINSAVATELFIDNRSPARLKGVLTSLQILSASRDISIPVARIAPALRSRMDIVVVALKDDYDPRRILAGRAYPRWIPQELRYAGLQHDAFLLARFARQWKNYAGIVAVITNPVDVVTGVLQRWLPRARVLGLGASLDSRRFRYALTRREHRRVAGGDVHVGGLHGGPLVPFRSLWPSRTQKMVTHSEMQSCAKEAESLGIQIVKNLGYTLHDCVSSFCDDIEWLISGKAKSLRVFSTSWAGGAVGVPFFRENAKTFITCLDALTNDERETLFRLASTTAPLVDRIASGDAARYEEA
jgi:malate/lactate dehydrogenase